MAAVSEHLVPEPGFVRPLRWGVVALGAYNAVDAAVDGAWVRAAVWTVITAGFLALQLRPPRRGTRVEVDGVRAGSTWQWGRLVAWGDVEQVHVQGPYDRASRLRVRGRRRPLLLPGMAADDVRALAAEHGLPVSARAGARAVDPPAGPVAADAAMDGPFRRSGAAPPPPARCAGTAVRGETP